MLSPFKDSFSTVIEQMWADWVWSTVKTKALKLRLARSDHYRVATALYSPCNCCPHIRCVIPIQVCNRLLFFREAFYFPQVLQIGLRPDNVNDLMKWSVLLCQEVIRVLQK